MDWVIGLAVTALFCVGVLWGLVHTASEPAPPGEPEPEREPITQPLPVLPPVPHQELEGMSDELAQFTRELREWSGLDYRPGARVVSFYNTLYGHPDRVPCEQTIPLDEVLAGALAVFDEGQK